MYVSYGSFTHPLSEVGFSITTELIDNGNGEYPTAKQRWQIGGMIVAADAAALTTAILAMEAAYRIPNQNLILYLPDGVTRSAHYVLAQNVQSIYAVQQPSYPSSAGGEYVTYRTFTIVMEAITKGPSLDDPGGGQGGGMTEFSESLEFWGGGPRYVHLPTLTGFPQAQQTQKATTYKALQTGNAIGLTGYPLAAAGQPIFPQALVDPDQVRIRKESPKTQGFGGARRFTTFPISWSYYFESPTPLVANPRTWK